MMRSKKGFCGLVIGSFLSGIATVSAAVSPQVPLAASAIPQFVQPLPRLSISGGTIATTHGNAALDITMCEFDANVLPRGTLAPGVQTTTRVYGYILGSNCPTTPQDTYLGPVLVNTRNGGSTNIRFVNRLGSTDSTTVPMWKYASDQTLHWADPLHAEENMCNHMSMFPPYMSECAQNYSGPIPAVPHLHGGEVPPELDGGPDAWFTSDGEHKGHAYYTSTVNGDVAPENGAIYRYPNTQEAAPIWFHDHTLGATRLNVYAGLAGAYLITDPNLELAGGLHPAGLMNGAGGSVEYTVPLVIQDRSFDTNGQLFFQADQTGGVLWATNPEHPYWAPELVGDVIVVNGKAWPFLDVEPKRYRFLFVNGSNARTYEMSLTDPVSKNAGPAIYLIATDGGYLDSPVKIDPLAANRPSKFLTMMPGERYEAIIDFSGFEAGKAGPNGVAYSGQWMLRNVGKTPYPAGTTPQGSTTGRIMQFNVRNCTTLCGTNDTSYNPAGGGAIRTKVAQKMVRLANSATGTLAAGVTVAKTRQLTLNEVMGMPQTVTDPVSGLRSAYPGGPLEILVNNSKWSGERITGVNDGMYTMEPIPGFSVDANGWNYLSELPKEGETEVWEIVNLTADAHPIHLHLVQFQVLNRQSFSVSGYSQAYAAAFPGGGYDSMTAAPYPPGVFIPGFGPPLPYSPSSATGQKYGGNPDVGLIVKGKPAFLLGLPKPPFANESGWKDTVIAFPKEVTRIAVRYAPTDKPVSAVPAELGYPFDPFAGGYFNYVWHCHIIDHEDNEMMRPTSVQINGAFTGQRLQKGVNY
jgi:spore coat protein A, manganese oxidase